MASEDLKPCPFCGGTNLKTGGDDKIVGVWCLTCQAAGPNHYGSREWNDRASPEPADWVKWDGGDFQPIPGEMFVMVMMRDGSIEGPARAREFGGSESCWKHRGSDGDIIAYRITARGAVAGAIAALDDAMRAMNRCEHDGGFDREIVPIGCFLREKCVCIGVFPLISEARRMLAARSNSTGGSDE
jgi:hypothetical protein